ncbi:XTP/dITP diphosphatase [Alkalihalobacillus pseudalcaliphilus]|uniref:XTP/dITP diphosphatase n=1 Tax=Alkalihalobacillus pseudalcaliphilus TaxID=79884 RepID=UPI00064DEE32|nr:XTP/dITP diphosphatase [Alkalihalobacillus pseudalcaliphilus]KMK74614.1 nucleoside-triphosphate diphosphatase [Alkalihalobacillus pseudalcaliphilus]
MENTLLIATKNQGKAKELISIFAEEGISVKTLLDYPDIPDIKEDGQTFAENAFKKAQEMANHFQVPVLADDSGLMVDALDGKPGVYSARYAGEDKDDEANIDKVLRELKDVPTSERTARFHCTLAFVFPNGTRHLFTGECEGIITETRQGNEGFGYDPIFYVVDLKKTMAELQPEQKNKISHRARALEQLKQNKHLLSW